MLLRRLDECLFESEGVFKRYSSSSDKNAMQAVNLNSDEKSQFRRQYPRRNLVVPVGVLGGGKYSIAQTGEIGEGGMSIKSEFVYELEKELVLSFQIPQGDFVFVRGVIKSSTKDGTGQMLYGLAFQDIQFAAKRQIRAYVSSRTLNKRP